MAAILNQIMALRLAQMTRIQEVTNRDITMTVLENSLPEDVMCGPLPQKTEMPNRNLGNRARSRKEIEAQQRREKAALQYVVDTLDTQIEMSWAAGVEKGTEAMNALVQRNKDIDGWMKEADTLQADIIAAQELLGEFLKDTPEYREGMLLLAQVQGERIAVMRNVEDAKKECRKIFGLFRFAWWESRLVKVEESLEGMALNVAKAEVEARKFHARSCGIASVLEDTMEGLEMIEKFNGMGEPDSPIKNQWDDCAPTDKVEEDIKPATLQDLVDMKKVEDSTKVEDKVASVIMFHDLNGDSRSAALAKAHRKVHGKKYHTKNVRVVSLPKKDKNVNKKEAKKTAQYAR